MRHLFVVLLVACVGCGKPLGGTAVVGDVQPTATPTSASTLSDEQRVLLDRAKKRLLDQTFDNEEDFRDAVDAMRRSKSFGEPVLLKAADLYGSDLDQTDIAKNRKLADNALARYRTIIEAIPRESVTDQHATRLVTRMVQYMSERIAAGQRLKNADDIAFLITLGPKAKDALPILKTIRDSQNSPEREAELALKAVRVIEVNANK